MSKNLVLYTMVHCPYCVKAKSLLNQRGLSFSETYIDDWSDQQWDDLAKKSGMKTVPQIYYGDRLIGGYTELAALDAKDQLASLKT